MKFPMCTLTSIISPGMYVVLSTDKEHISAIRRLERCMTKEMSSQRHSDVQLASKMIVAVGGIKEAFARGVLENKINNDMYEVMLMDYGEIVKAKISSIRIITNKNFLKLEPLAFVVKLYGLIPCKYIQWKGNRMPKALKDWGIESQEFIKDLFKENCKIVVESIKIEERLVYGDLFIKDRTENRYISLRKLLCKNEFCAYSVSAFVKQEGLSLSTDNAEGKNKMELVQNWREKNFAEPKKSSFPLASAKIASPSTSTSDAKTPNLPGCSTSRHKKSRNYRMAQASKGEEKFVTTTKRENLKFPKVRKQKEKHSSCNQKTDAPLRASFGEKPIVSLTDWDGKAVYLQNLLGCRQTAEVEGSISDFENIDFKKESEELSTTNEAPLTKLQDAVFLSDEFSELDDSKKFSEVSSTLEDEECPPLTGNGPKKNNLENTQVSAKEEEVQECTEIQETSGIEELSETEESQENSDGKEKENLRISSVSPEQLDRPGNVVFRNRSTAFVLFDDCLLESVKTFRELPIKPVIIKNLEKGSSFKDLSQIQSWAIPAIRKQHNTVIMGSPKTGKTLSYLIPILDYVLDESYFAELPVGNGPVVVILASSSGVCESIYLSCLTLLGCKETSSEIKFVVAYGGDREKEMWVNLTNGCDILISTPPCLLRLLEFPILTNLERLMCLVLDEANILSENPFRKHVRTILEKAELSTKGRHYQRVLCGEKWTGKVESIVKEYVKSHTVVMGSYLEAIMYEKLIPGIVFVNKKQKNEILAEKVKERLDSKVVIFCENAAQVMFLNKLLTEKGILNAFAHEKLLSASLKETENAWKDSEKLVLLMSDGVLNDIEVKQADVLIHYGLPTKSKTNFFLRFATVLNSNERKGTFQKAKVRVLILVDDENHLQLPHIAELVERLGGKLPERIMQRCYDIRRMIEMSKQDAPICSNVLMFGRCRNSRYCPWRHAFVKSLDAPENLPTGGWVNFVVIKILDVAVMSARLVELVDVDGTMSKLEDKSGEIRMMMEKYFKEEDNMKPLGVVQVGEVCGVRDEANGGVFYRAKVIEVVKVDKYGKALEVKVKLLDEGNVWKRERAELYKLPKELRKMGATAVDVRMVGVQPLDFDVNWNDAAFEFMKNMMMQKMKEDQYWSGQVVVALDNTLFLDSIKRQQFLPHLNVHVFDLVVRDEMVNHKIAIGNPTHLRTLHQLCREAGMELPRKEERRKEDCAKMEPQWAFFDADVMEVKFLSAESTSIVFLQPKKYEKLLEALEEDCQKEGKKRIEEMKSVKGKGKKSSDEVERVSVGMYCLARFEDGKWNRGRVESEEENELYVFFVDHGDFQSVKREDVVPISVNLMLRLPCQAVECRLVGIVEEEEQECPMDVLREMYGFSDDGKEYLYARVVSKEQKGKITNGRKYKVNLMSKKGVSLSRKLIELEMVRALEEESCHLGTEEIEVSEEEKEEDEGEEEEEEENWEEEQEKEEEHLMGEEKTVDVSKESVDYYLGSLADEVFQDEQALDFLKEFASKLFPDVEGFEMVEDEGEVIPEATRVVEQKVQWRPNTQQKERNRTGRDLKLKNREKVLTPQVLWWQTEVEVGLRILLGNVTDYSLECSHGNLSFRCLLEEKLYAVDLRLFGAVNPQKTIVMVKAFDVSVVMKKLAYPVWPRLHLDEGKHRWISLDVERLKDKEGEFGEKIVKVKREMDAGKLKEGLREERIRAYSDSEDSEGDGTLSVSEGSDGEEDV